MRSLRRLAAPGLLRSRWWEKHITHSSQHARTVTCAIFSPLLLSLSLSPLSRAIESISMTGILFCWIARAWSDTDAKTFLKLVVFPSGSPAPLSLLLYSCVFSLLPSRLFHSSALLKVTVNGREREQERDFLMFLFAYVLDVCALTVQRKAMCTPM